MYSTTKNFFESGVKIISATRSDEEFIFALSSASNVLFDLNPDIMNVSVKVKRCHEADKMLFVHIDLAKGIGKDESAIRFLKRIGVDGIISTKVSLIRMARECGLYTVQRFFVVDSQSLHTIPESVKSSKPDMIEIMPGTLCKIIEKVTEQCDIPVIAGGLIESREEICRVIESGASAVSTGKSELWNAEI
jgi:glycerol uptake operon antiterminator